MLVEGPLERLDLLELGLAVWPLLRQLADRKFGAFRFHGRVRVDFIADVLASVSLAADSGSWHDDRSRARHSLAQHAAAVPARPHQPVAARRRGRLDHRRYRHWQ